MSQIYYHLIASFICFSKLILWNNIVAIIIQIKVLYLSKCKAQKAQKIQDISKIQVNKILF